MRRHAAVLGISLAAWSGIARADVPESPSTPAPAPAPAPAPGTPGADQIQFAAREHDLGYRSYIDKQYDEAASHFENAFFAAPEPRASSGAPSAPAGTPGSSRARRRSRPSASGGSRVTQLTGKVAADVIAQARPHVHEVLISSSAEFSVAIDDKIVAAERVKEFRLFVTPGGHQLLVSWSDERNTRIPIDAREGGTQSLELEPPAETAGATWPSPCPSP